MGFSGGGESNGTSFNALRWLLYVKFVFRRSHRIDSIRRDCSASPNSVHDRSRYVFWQSLWYKNCQAIIIISLISLTDYSGVKHTHLFPESPNGWQKPSYCFLSLQQLLHWLFSRLLPHLSNLHPNWSPSTIAADAALTMSPTKAKMTKSFILTRIWGRSMQWACSQCRSISLLYMHFAYLWWRQKSTLEKAQLRVW